MDLKAAVVLVCLCAALITSTKGNYSNKEYFAEVFFLFKKTKTKQILVEVLAYASKLW